MRTGKIPVLLVRFKKLELEWLVKVCFINPPITPYRLIMRNFDCATESKGNYLYQPYDFLLMSAKVPEHWPLLFIDAVADKLSDDAVLRQVRDDAPEVIVCALAATNWKQDLGFLKRLRGEFPAARLLVFGDLFIEDHACREVEKYCEAVLTSPVMFEFSLLEKLSDEGLRQFEGAGIRQDQFYQRKDLKNPVEFSLQRVRHELFLHPRYRWPFARHFRYTTVFTAWGCPYSCSYCILNKFPNYWRQSEEILEEMKQIHQTGIREIYIGDRSFGLPTANVKKLLEEMIANQFHFSWSTYFHPNQYSPELLELMKKSGCHTIIVGVESKNLNSLKQFGRHVRQDQFFQMIEHARKLQINICGDFILGLPKENRDDIEETIAFSRELGLAYASFNIAAPLAGSSIRQEAQSIGLMKDNEEEFDSFGRNKIVSVCGVSDKELRSLRNKAVMSFYFRPGYLLKRLSHIKNWEHFLIQYQEAQSLLLKSLGF